MMPFTGEPRCLESNLKFSNPRIMHSAGERSQESSSRRSNPYGEQLHCSNPRGAFPGDAIPREQPQESNPRSSHPFQRAWQSLQESNPRRLQFPGRCWSQESNLQETQSSRKQSSQGRAIPFVEQSQVEQSQESQFLFRRAIGTDRCNPQLDSDNPIESSSTCRAIPGELLSERNPREEFCGSAHASDSNSREQSQESHPGELTQPRLR